jgi:hypothetical protein
MKLPCTLVVLWTAVRLTAVAGDVMLRITACNPAETTRVVTVRSPLPIGTRPEDVIDDGGFDIAYDVCANRYCAMGPIEVPAGETHTVIVRLRDVWSVPVEVCDRLAGHAAEIADLLSSPAGSAVWHTLPAPVHRNIALIRASQASNALGRATAEQHIAAYWRDCHRLDAIKDTFRELEDAAIRQGMTPRHILGELPPGSGEGTRAYAAPAGELVLRLRLANLSPDLPRCAQISHPLPHELAETDILETDGLRLQRDARTRTLTVVADEIDIGPGESRAFAIRIRDVWGAQTNRCERLLIEADAIRALAPRRYASIHRLLDRTVDQLRLISRKRPPLPDDRDYIAFFRVHGKQLDRLERNLLRIERAPFPDNPIGTTTPHPTPRTTWMMIYATLAFLAMFSTATLIANFQFASRRE